MSTTEKKTPTRIYKVTITAHDGIKTHHLVRTTHPSRASAHATRNMIDVQVATQDDLADLLATTPIETAVD